MTDEGIVLTVQWAGEIFVAEHWVAIHESLGWQKMMEGKEKLKTKALYTQMVSILACRKHASSGLEITFSKAAETGVAKQRIMLKRNCIFGQRKNRFKVSFKSLHQQATSTRTSVNP